MVCQYHVHMNNRGLALSGGGVGFIFGYCGVLDYAKWKPKTLVMEALTMALTRSRPTSWQTLRFVQGKQ